MNSTAMHIHDPRELLALVPHRLGFHPQESVVLLSLRPPRGQVGLCVRVDLADLTDREHGPVLARGLVAHLDRDQAERTVAIVYAADDPRGDPRHPAHAAVRVLRRAAAAPFGEVPVWVVTATGYLDLDAGFSSYPAGGRPLRDLAGTQIGAQMVLSGSVVVASRADLARVRTAGADARRAVSRARVRWQARRERAEGADAQELLAWRRAGLAAWRDEAAGASSVRTLARVESALADVPVRDAVLMSLLPDTADLPERSLAGGLADEMQRAMDQVYDDVVGVLPPEAATERHQQALERVVAHGRSGHQAPARTLLALLAWWSGDGARTGAHLERALKDDPGYRLALLLEDVLVAGLPPGWARRQLRVECAAGEVR